MKLLIEKASAPDGPPPKKGPDSLFARWRERTPSSVVTPLKRLGVILLGESTQG